MKGGDKVIIMDHPTDGIKILPYLSEEELQSVLEPKIGRKIIKEITRERKKEIIKEEGKFNVANQ